jgi:hypothetical protein
MPDLTNAERKTIKVQGIMLEAYSPYVEGHVCLPNEANALNQTLQENLRNNFAPTVKKAVITAYGEKGTSEQLTDEQRATLQEKFESYCEAYEFGERGTRESDPVKSRAIQFAIEAVKAALKKNGIKLADVGPEKIRARAEDAVEKNPAFMQKAEKVIAAEREAAAELVVEL